MIKTKRQLLLEALPFIEGQRDGSEWDEVAIGLAAEIRQTLDEGGMTNLEWLYHESSMFRASMCFWAVYFGHAADDIEADEWLMSKYAENGRSGDNPATIVGDREGVNS